MELPDTQAIASVRWQFFLTLTFTRDDLSDGRRRRLAFAFLRRVASLLGRDFRRMLWVLREEHGEIGGRFHYHALIGGVDERHAHKANCFRLMALWQKAPGPTGWARCTVYDRGSDAVAYVLKGLDQEGYLGDLYEGRKFVSSHCQLTVARSVLRVARRVTSDTARSTG